MKKLTLFLMVLILFGFFAISVFAQSGYRFQETSGHSMSPTITDGEWVILNVKVKPKVGDIIMVELLSPKTFTIEHPEPTQVIKRLTKIENNCWYLQGDNHEHSIDSDDYGFLCDDEKKLIGVILNK